MEKQYLADTDSLKKEYESLAQHNQEIDDSIISLYADKAKGILTEKRFLKLTDAMEKEQESNQTRMQEIAALISEEVETEYRRREIPIKPKRMGAKGFIVIKQGSLEQDPRYYHFFIHNQTL